MTRSVDSLLAEARQARHDGSYSEAIRAFEDVLGQFPSNLAARIEYAGSLIQAGRIHDAGPIVAALVRTMPQHPGVRAEAGALMRARGLFAEALAHYEIAAEHAPDPTLTLIAVADVARAMGRHARAVTAATEATERSPNFAPAWLALAAAARDSGDAAGERAALRRGADADPSSIAPLLALARAATDAGDVSLAEAALAEAEARAPHHAGPLVARGHAALAMGRIPDALADFQAAADRDPAALAGATGLLHCIIRLGRTDEAAAVLADAEARFGPRAELAMQRAALAQAEGCADEARAAWRVAMSEPSDNQHARWETWFRCEMMLGTAKDRADCIAAAMPGNALERTSVARAAAQSAEAEYEWETARRLYAQAVATAPADGTSMDGLARIAALQLDAGAALDWLKRQSVAEKALRARLGRPRNASQTETGQIALEFRLDRAGCDTLREVLPLPPVDRIAPLKAAMRDLPDSTAVALWLLISLRTAGVLDVPAPATGPRIPRRLLWLLPRGTEPGSPRVEAWRKANPGIEIVEMDRQAAAHFVDDQFGATGRRAWLRAQDGGARIDLVRLVWLAQGGGWSVLPGARAVAPIERLPARGAAFFAGQGAWGAPMPFVLGAAAGSAVAATAAARVVEAMARGDADHRWLCSEHGLLARAVAAVISVPATAAEPLRLVRPRDLFCVVQPDASGLWNGAHF